MEAFNLDTPLLNLSGIKTASQWTARQAVEGVQIFGGIGSGKSSGSGRTLALKYLKAGFGGLVLTVKPEERKEWQDYCKLTGREDDLLIVSPSEKNYFNFLEYESQGRGMTENIVQVLKTVINASEEKGGKQSSDSFWETALDMLLFNIIDLCKLAYGHVTIQMMYDIVQTLPKKDAIKDDKETAYKKAFLAAKDKAKEKVIRWQQSQDPQRIDKLKAVGLFHEAISNEVLHARTFALVEQFFNESFMTLNERTRSIIDFSFSGFLFRLLREPVHSLFCKNTSTFTPENSLDGKIILIDLPIKIHHKIGRDCQILFKYIWQRAMEKRNTSENNRPVFLWADEAQNFIHELDAEFQATARSSCVATVYISQNIPNYHANMGGQKSNFRVQSFLGTLGTKIFHANADVETNKYASELIGDGAFIDTQKGTTMSGSFSSSRNQSMKIDRLVRPEEFNKLKTGGNLNDNKVEGYIHVQGNTIKDDANYARIVLDQNYLKEQSNNL